MHMNIHIYTFMCVCVKRDSTTSLPYMHIKNIYTYIHACIYVYTCV